MPSDLGSEICAFANASCGAILLGIPDTGEVAGVGDYNRLKWEVQSTARSTEPPIGDEIASVVETLRVAVPTQHSKPKSFGGRSHVGEGASSQQLSCDEVREFICCEGLIQADETTCGDFDPAVDFTLERWQELAEHVSFDLSVEPIAVLENQRLLREGAMTHASAWLLANDTPLRQG